MHRSAGMYQLAGLFRPKGFFIAVFIMLCGCDRLESQDVSNQLGDAERGRLALHQYACITCHAIPNVGGENAMVGPPLKGMAKRKFIAGILPNTPDNMLRWLQHPQEVDPDSAMPDLGVSERDARDMAAYLYQMK